MTEQQLNATVHRLTRPHKTLHVDPLTKNASYPTEMSLFEQLRIEQASGRRGGVASGSGSRSPVAISALILWTEIREILNTRHIAITGTDGPKLDPEGKLELWVADVNRTGEPDAAAHCLKTTAGWINAIEELLNPEPSIEIRGACPACQETHAWTLQDGEYIRNTALTSTVHIASCRHCGATWAGSDLNRLAAAVREDQAA